MYEAAIRDLKFARDATMSALLAAERTGLDEEQIEAMKRHQAERDAAIEALKKLTAESEEPRAES